MKTNQKSTKQKDIELICRLDKDWNPDNIKLKRAGGQTNRNWIVQYKNKKFFVRLPWERTDIVDRRVEAKNILAISKCKKLAGVVPKYFLYILSNKNILKPESREIFKLPDGTMLTEYIKGKLLTITLFKQKKYQEKLAQMFYIFHISDVKFKNKYNVFKDEIEKYRINAKKYPLGGFVNKETILNFENIEKEAFKKILFLQKGEATHNDFIFQNFLIGKDGNVYLLDFEYAGLNIKGGILYDFAFLFADNLFRNPPISQVLFEKFLKIADRIYKQPLDRNQIYWLAVAVPVMQFWWGLLRYFSVKTKKEKKYFKEYILKRAKGIEFLYKLISKNNKG